jgi:enediyne biosynthesis protein E4
MLGYPGVGKGTRRKRLVEHLGIPGILWEQGLQIGPQWSCCDPRLTDRPSGVPDERSHTSVVSLALSDFAIVMVREFVALLACACLTLAQGSPSPSRTPAKAANFVDIAELAGLHMKNVFGGVEAKQYILETTGTGVAIVDYDNDGWPDIFLINGTTLQDFPDTKAPTNHLYHNNHDGTFADVTTKAGLSASGWGQGACAGDYDNDGWPDIYITYFGKNHLYHNEKGVFTDLAEQAGVAGSGDRWGTGCAFVDYNRDGRLDLILANYVKLDLATTPTPGKGTNCTWKGTPVMCGPRGLAGDKNILYENLGNGKFVDVTQKARIDRTNGMYAFGVATLDYNDDGWPDIYVACDSAPSILYRNNHDGTFTDQAVTAGVAFNEDGREQAGMGVTIADYNGDGRPDIFKTNFSDDTPTLYRNGGDGAFTDVTYQAGVGKNTQYLGWGTMFFDFDNDGWPDLILVNGHVYPEVDIFHLGSQYKQSRLLYHNNGDGTFIDITSGAGSGITTPSSSRGMAVADLWNDGQLSVVINNMNAPPSLLVNRVSTDNHWVTFRTVGKQSNRDGIGAKITVRTGKRVLVDEVRSGSSYNSQNDLRVHFGLGCCDHMTSVEVRWPSGLTETFGNLSTDAIDTLIEGSGKVLPVPGAKKR